MNQPMIGTVVIAATLMSACAVSNDSTAVDNASASPTTESAGTVPVPATVVDTPSPAATTTITSSVAVDSGRLEEAGRDVAQRWLQESERPGALVVIAAPGQPTVAFGVGGSSADGAGYGVSTPVRAASLTKSMVAVEMLILAERGLIDLDDTIEEWVPSWPRAEQVSVRQLLLHTSGAGDFGNDATDGEFFSLVSEDLDRFYTLDEAIALAAQRPGGSIGEFNYSNANYLLAGRIIEIVTAQPLAEVLHTDVFEPLAMTGTYLDAGITTPPAPVASGLFSFDGGASYVDTSPFASTALISLLSPAAGVVSTVEDLARFGTAVYRDGVLVSKDWLSEMLTFPPDSGQTRHGLGVSVLPVAPGPCDERAERPDDAVYGHLGTLPGATTRLAYDARTGIVIVATTNQWATRSDDELLTELTVTLVETACELLP